MDKSEQQNPPPPYFTGQQSAPASSSSAAAASAGYGGQLQDQQLLVINQNQELVASVPLVQSFASHIILSCFTFWCCGCVCGLIAFILAVMAQSKSTSPNATERMQASQLGKASMSVSIAGIIIGTVLIIVMLCIRLSNGKDEHY